MVYLLERMDRAAGDSGTVTFLSSRGDDERVGWGELYSDAVRVAAALQAAGVGPGRSVVVLGLTSNAVPVKA
jgi:fatty-acyl-CoA synthase